MKCFFFHGLESGPHGTKYRHLKECGHPDLISPDFRGLMTLPERVAAAKQAIGSEDCILVGSSFGGATALLVSALMPNVKGLVMIAPALHKVDTLPLLPTLPVVVVHGDQDDICPLGNSQEFCQRAGHELLIVEDEGHRCSSPMALAKVTLALAKVEVRVHQSSSNIS